MRNKRKNSFYHHSNYLLSLLDALDGVQQSPKYHPESDTLYHSLQVFDLAYHDSNDPELWAAALFHDVGKAEDQQYHARVGAEMVAGIFSQRVIWLIEHHLDLLIHPRKTRRALAGTKQLGDLTQLRGWDLGGRSPFAEVTPLDTALDIVLVGLQKADY